MCLQSRLSSVPASCAVPHCWAAEMPSDSVAGDSSGNGKRATIELFHTASRQLTECQLINISGSWELASDTKTRTGQWDTGRESNWIWESMSCIIGQSWYQVIFYIVSYSCTWHWIHGCELKHMVYFEAERKFDCRFWNPVEKKLTWLNGRVAIRWWCFWLSLPVQKLNANNTDASGVIRHKLLPWLHDYVVGSCLFWAWKVSVIFLLFCFSYYR